MYSGSIPLNTLIFCLYGFSAPPVSLVKTKSVLDTSLCHNVIAFRSSVSFMHSDNAISKLSAYLQVREYMSKGYMICRAKMLGEIRMLLSLTRISTA